jgi:hypothetical protein
MNSEGEEPRSGGGKQPDLEEYAPLSVREARLAFKRTEELWPYVWMNLVSMILLIAALAIGCYRVGAQSCVGR